jgi:hypothetical protein
VSSAQVKSLEIEAGTVKDLALIDQTDGIWLVYPLRWWDLATWIWWHVTPSDRRATVTLTNRAGVKFKCKAVRVAARHVRVRWKS